MTDRRLGCDRCRRLIRHGRPIWHLTGCTVLCSRCIDSIDGYDRLVPYDGCREPHPRAGGTR